MNYPESRMQGFLERNIKKMDKKFYEKKKKTELIDTLDSLEIENKKLEYELLDKKTFIYQSSLNELFKLLPKSLVEYGSVSTMERHNKYIST